VCRPNVTFPGVAFNVTALGFDVSGASDAAEMQLTYEFGFLSNASQLLEVSDTWTFSTTYHGLF
jgi:hypothetical protein